MSREIIFSKARKHWAEASVGDRQSGVLSRSIFWSFATALILLGFSASPAQAQSAPPSFSAAFQPGTIGPGSSTTLVFTIDNTGSALPVSDLAFADNLPAGVQLATPAHAVNDCGGILTAPDGGSTLSLSGGTISGASVCSIRVLVSSSVVGVHTNGTGALTSDAGNSGSATADLTVASDRPGFSKSFSPSTLSYGNRVRLSFLIDNTANGTIAYGASFTDTLPAGLVIADPPNALTDCVGGSLIAAAGSSQVSLGPPPGNLFGETLAAGASCTASIDLRATAAGRLENVTTELSTYNQSFQQHSSGMAAAVLDVTAGEINLVKTFADDPVAPGSTVSLEFTLVNRSRDFPATGISFSDDLGATLPGLAAIGLPLSDVCGAGSQISGAGVLSFSGGSIPPQGSCTFQLSLQVPAGALPGVYPNTTSAVTATMDGGPIVGDPAGDSLFVWPAPVLVKEFTDDPVGAGGTVTLQFSLSNPSTTDAATDISFTDELTNFLPFPVSVGTVSPDPPCGASSSLALVSFGFDQQGLLFSGGSLPAGGQCQFSITIDIPQGMPGGFYLNTTSVVDATLGGTVYQGAPAVDQLQVVGAPRILEEFTDDPVLPGGTVTLQFNISHDEQATGPATNIAFTDDLNASLAGLAAIGLPTNDICGTGSQLSGTTTLSLSGGQLNPGESCTFSVSLQVPAAASPGLHANATSALSADVGGAGVIGLGAADTLLVSGLSLSKNFLDDPVLPGQASSLEFTINNLSATDDATGISFTDSLSAVLSGLTSSGLTQNDLCGAGSQLQIIGGNFLILTGGNLMAGTSCSFSVPIQVPAAAADGSYLNVTSALSATINGSPAVLPPAVDHLNVDSQRLGFSKEFIDDPVLPGDNVTLRFTLENLDNSNPVSVLSFTDDLGAALAGLTATGTPMNDVCGPGSQMAGTSVLTLTGGSLAPGASCSFDVVLQTPAGAALGTVVTNTTSTPSGTILGLPVTGGAASDELQFQLLSFSKTFGGPTAAGAPAILSFTIANTSSISEVNGIDFTDDLDAVISGLAAVSLPAAGFCGPGSTISGSSLLSISGASLPPLGSCTFQVGLLTPPSATAGTYINTTSDVSSNGLPAAAPATDSLIVEPPPAFSKSFSPAAIGMGEGTTLSFLIDATANTLDGTALDFTDTLPAGLVIATPANASSSCTGGALTAVSGGSVISYTGGRVSAGSICQITVDLAPTAPGTFLNTSGNLTSSLGDSGTASASILVEGPPAFSKSFSPAAIGMAEQTTLSFLIDATGNTLDGTALDFMDSLPAGLVIATPANATSSCAGGTLTAVSGSSVISYTGGTVSAASICQITVDLVPTAPGTFLNTSGNLTSSLGDSGTTSASILVEGPPAFSKSFNPASIGVGQNSTLAFLIDASANTIAGSGLSFVDNLPAGMQVANPANVSSTCTGGTVTASPGGTSVAYSGGGIPAGGSCTISVDITANLTGALLNLSGDLSSSLGNSGTAQATLSVNPQPVFSKSFQINPMISGGSTALVFSIDNSGAGIPADSLDFSDALPAGMVISNPSNASTSCSGGNVSATPGGALIAYSGGSAPSAAGCSVSVDITAASAGTYVNTSGVLSSSLGTSPPATDTLVVSDVVFTLEKSFSQALVIRGGSVDLEYTITNPSTVFSLTDITFSDDFSGLPGMAAVGLPQNDICGTGSQIGGTSSVSFSGGSLAPSSSCTFTISLVLPGDAALGLLTSTSSPATALSAGGSTSAGAATDSFEIVFFDFSKSFLGVGSPNAGVQLQFVLSNPDPVNSIDGISFSDDLDAVIPGMMAYGLPQLDVCGLGSSLTGTSLISFSGGHLDPGASCAFTLTVIMPPEALDGEYLNTTSIVTATVNGTPIAGDSGSEAQAPLQVNAQPIPASGLVGRSILVLLLMLSAAVVIRRT